MKSSRLLLNLFAATLLAFTVSAQAEDASAPTTEQTTSTDSAATAQSADSADAPQSVVVVGSPSSANSSDSKSWYASAWDTAGVHLSDLWTKGDVEVYVPFWTYHMPFAYTPEKRNNFNDFPAGVGLGKGWYNASGNWEGVYAMTFQDSHAQQMYMAGYGWIPTWNPINEQTRLGIGATVFLFMREDINSYAPTPGILPMVSAGYGPVDIQMAYIPGGKGNGNVLFWWAKFAFR